MTPFQIVALSVLAAVVFFQFALPHIKWPEKKVDTMKNIQSVIAIKESSTNVKVVEACNTLLQALLS